MKIDKVVYLHRRKSDGQVFYVGMGSLRRAHTFELSQRSKDWVEYVSIVGLPIVDIVAKNLSKYEAETLESQLIRYYAKIGNICNISKNYGGNISDKTLNTAKDCIKSRIKDIDEFAIPNLMLIRDALFKEAYVADSFREEELKKIKLIESKRLERLEIKARNKKEALRKKKEEEQMKKQEERLQSVLNDELFKQWLIQNRITRIGNTKIYKSSITKKTYYEVDLIKMYENTKSVATS